MEITTTNYLGILYIYCVKNNLNKHRHYSIIMPYTPISELPHPPAFLLIEEDFLREIKKGKKLKSCSIQQREQTPFKKFRHINLPLKQDRKHLYFNWEYTPKNMRGYNRFDNNCYDCIRNFTQSKWLTQKDLYEWAKMNNLSVSKTTNIGRLKKLLMTI